MNFENISGKMSLIMKYYVDEDLKKYFNKTNEQENIYENVKLDNTSLKVAIEVASGMKYLQSQRVRITC